MSITAASVDLSVVTQHRLDDMRSGWVLGDFEPVAHRTGAAEVAVKHVEAGSHEPLHEQLVATEVTVVVTGRVRLAGRVLGPGDVLVIPPRVRAEFLALADSTIVVIKTPSDPSDKHVTASGC